MSAAAHGVHHAGSEEMPRGCSRVAAEVAVLCVGWPVYEAFLDDARDGTNSRIANDGQVLEIISPTPKHEVYNRLVEVLVRETARRWHIDLVGFGSTTFHAKPRGAEPDSSFFLGARAALMRDRERVDLACDPLPDIVVEIDISRQRIEKRPVYAALGVPEFRRYDGERLRADDLSIPEFPPIAASKILRELPIAELDRFLEMRAAVSHSALPDLWAAWLRDHAPHFYVAR